MKIQKMVKSILLVLSLVSIISCGSQKPMVENVKVSTSVVDNDIYLSLSAQLGIGNLSMPSASFPIVLPKIGKEIGLVTLGSAAGSPKSLKIEINISETANLELASVRLPNGTMVPLIAENKALIIPLNKVVVYISLSPGAEAIGIAVPIRTFDGIGRKVGTTSLMPLFNKNGIIGAAGVFTSKTAGQNGFALVADVSSKLKNKNLSFGNSQIQMQQADLDYRGFKPSRRAERKINKALLKLNRKRKQLRLR